MTYPKLAKAEAALQQNLDVLGAFTRVETFAPLQGAYR
jgi:hypothetical protein